MQDRNLKKYRIIEIPNAILSQCCIFKPKQVPLNGKNVSKRQISTILNDEQLQLIVNGMAGFPGFSSTPKAFKLERTEEVKKYGLSQLFIKVKDKVLTQAPLLDKSGKPLTEDHVGYTLAHLRLMAVPYEVMGVKGVSLQVLKVKVLDKMPDLLGAALKNSFNIIGQSTKEPSIFDESTDDPFNV